MKPDESRNARPNDIIAADGGVVAPVVSDRDPYEVLDDLMCVVEALCPTWPQRAPFTGEEKFRL
jgi:hypothetical protein